MAPTPRRSELHRSAFYRSAAHTCALILLSASTLLLTACGNFFSCEGKASCPCASGVTSTTTNPCGGGGGSSSVDYAYVANSATNTTTVDGYNLGSGTLATATSAPYSFGYSPSSLVVTPANTYLYAATDSALNSGSGYVYGYSIGTGGALSILSSGEPLVSESVSSLAVSPDGKWLFCLDTNSSTLEEYSIDTSTGALTFAQTYGVTGTTNGVITPAQITVAPSGDFVVLALGTGGAETFSLNETSGVATFQTLLSPSNASTGIYAAAVDANNYLYLAGTAGLSVYSTTTAGVPTLLKTYSTGSGAHSVVVNTDATYVYVGNQSDSTISAFSIGTNAALTAVSGSPFTAPTTVTALAFDSTMAYLIASGYEASTGIELYTIGTTGALTSAGTAASGTSTTIPGAIATTH